MAAVAQRQQEFFRAVAGDLVPHNLRREQPKVFRQGGAQRLGKIVHLLEFGDALSENPPPNLVGPERRVAAQAAPFSQFAATQIGDETFLVRFRHQFPQRASTKLHCKPFLLAEGMTGRNRRLRKEFRPVHWLGDRQFRRRETRDG
jgi:hypothetical protein